MWISEKKYEELLSDKDKYFDLSEKYAKKCWEFEQIHHSSSLHCLGCKHLIVDPTPLRETKYVCKLNNQCKDYEEDKDENKA